MNISSLRFHNPSLETKYRDEISQHSIKKFVFFIILGNLLIEFIQILIIFWKATILPYTLLPCEIFLIIIIVYLHKRSSVYLLMFLRFNLIGQAVLLVEMICRYLENYETHDISLALVIPFQIFQSITIYVKNKWISSSLFYFFSLLYFFLRKNLMDYTESVPTVGLIFFSSWVIYSLMAYDHEKKFKEFYKKMMDSYEKVNYFKLILQNVIPASIFIVDYRNSHLKFTNNSGRNLINSKDFLHDFLNYEHFIQNLQIFSDNTSENPEDLTSKLKSYYNDPLTHPLKADLINDTDLLDDRFQIFNVHCSPIPSSETFTSNNDLPAAQSRKRYYEIKITKIFWEDTICLLLLFNDNTNVFKISELVNMDGYKNQILATVSHDLRTPLNGLNGMLELAIYRTEDKGLKSFLELAKKSACFLNYLVHDILDFSLMNFKKMRLNIEEVNLKEIIAEIMSLVEFQAIEKTIELRFEIKNEGIIPFFSDRTRIKQILLNLLSNAIKFTSKGFIKVSLQAEGPLYKISVEDSGIGIKQENLPKLFCLFGRIDDEEKVNKTGIGLGLTISRQISRFLCPEKPEGVEVESVWGEGSTFSFFLSSLQMDDERPRLKLEKNVKEQSELLIELNQNEKSNKNGQREKMPRQKWTTLKGEPEEKTEKIDRNNSNNVGEEHNSKERHIDFPEVPSSPIRHRFFEECERLNFKSSLTDLRKARTILVVDDDLMNLMIAEEYLKVFGFQTVRALNGLEAYKVVKQDIKRKKNQIFLVLMDCNMPIMDGFQASNKIQKICTKMKREKIPILAVSANATAKDKLLCKSAGMEFFLEKPMRKSELKKTLEAILKESIGDEK